MIDAKMPWLEADETRDCLNEVANVLAKFSCGIVNKDGRTILVKIEGPGRLKAIAQIEEVSPLNMEFGRFLYEETDTFDNLHPGLIGKVSQ